MCSIYSYFIIVREQSCCMHGPLSETQVTEELEFLNQTFPILTSIGNHKVTLYMYVEQPCYYDH